MAYETTKPAPNEAKQSTDSQRTGDRALRHDQSSLGGETSGDSIMKRDLRVTASGIADTVARKAQAAGEAVSDAGENVAGRARHAHEVVCDFTRANPTTALLVALGVGALVARMLPQR